MDLLSTKQPIPISISIPIQNGLNLEKPDKIPIPQSIEEKLNYFIETNEIPHIIFHGSSGTGKKTIVYQFIHRIYKKDKQKIKSNVMTVNCAHGKGIKFIREELKFFAKKNIQANSEVSFKTIVLFNADFLTIDAQSALRRCIELFSYNTRFFIVVENKYKLLNPILSRFCEIYIPETVKDGKIIHLHEYNIHQHTLDYDLDENEVNSQNMKFVKERLDAIYFLKKESQRMGVDIDDIHIDIHTNPHIHFIELAELFYKRAISCLDIIKYIEKAEWWESSDKMNFITHFYQIKSEYRCEKLLILCMLDYIHSHS